MSKIDSWVTKIPRLKNSKVARFSYRAEAYANDEIEGVDSYDYAQDMNVPLATHTDFDADMLSIGARTNFSSVPKNGLNHFFGRVSYNLNKVIDFLSDLLDDFISFTEIVEVTSSATLSAYANGTTKRLLSTAGSTITITLPAGETYLGSNTILLAPSIMLTITKRGTVWINSSGNAITADRAKDSYPIPTDAVLQYSFDEIKQLPDNHAGTVYKRDNDWTTVDGWSGQAGTVVAIDNMKLRASFSGANTLGASMYRVGTNNGKFIVGKVQSQNAITSIKYYNGTILVDVKIIYITPYEAYFVGKITSTFANTIIYINNGSNSANIVYFESIYIGDGSYLDPVIDNSYSESHAENHGVIPVDGVCGKAGYFNNSYMIAPRPALGDDITIYFWAKLDSLTGMCIVQSRETVNVTGLYVFVSTLGYGLNWGGVSANFPSHTVPVNTWHHVTIKSNQATRQLKINNVLTASSTGTYTNHTNFSTNIIIGKSAVPDGNPLTGALDGLKIVPRYTTDDEDIGEYKARANLPKFYATADKLKTARKINGVDFDGTADIYDTYSTTEHRIGTWIDGKPLYRKVINFGALPNTTNKNVAHGISNLDKTIRLYGIAQTPIVITPLPYTDGGIPQNTIGLCHDKIGNITILTWMDYSTSTAIVIIEYTKTTD